VIGFCNGTGGVGEAKAETSLGTLGMANGGGLNGAGLDGGGLSAFSRVCELALNDFGRSTTWPLGPLFSPAARDSIVRNLWVHPSKKVRIYMHLLLSHPPRK
jgi:hypothetical protein